MDLLPGNTTYNENSASEVASIKLKKLSYHEIKSLDQSKRIADPDFQLLRHLKSLILPNSKMDINYLRDMKQSRLAFECATALTNDESYEYCQPYYKKVIRPLLTLLNENSLYYNSLEELDKYMGIGTLADTNAMLRTLALCLTESTVDLKIFNEFPPIIWRREMLLKALFSNDHSWNLTLVQRIIEKIDNKIDLLAKQNRCLKIENILEYLLSNQRFEKITIQLLIDILDFISKEDNNDIAKYITNTPIMILNHENEIQAVTLEWKSSLQIIFNNAKFDIIRDCCRDIEADAGQLLNDFLIHYSYEMIKYFVDLIRDIGNIEIMKVIKLLTFLDMTMTPPIEIEQFLYSLTSYNSIVWRCKFISFITLKIISNEFPEYGRLMNSQALEEESVSESSILLKLYQNIISPWLGGDKLTLSNTTYLKVDCKHKNNLLKSKKVHHLLNNLHEKLISFMAKITDENLPETINIMIKLIGNLDSEEKIGKLGNCLEILRDYNVEINEKEILDIFDRSSCKNIEQNVHEFVIKTELPGTHLKGRDELLRDLERLNNDVDISNILPILSEVDRMYNGSQKQWNSSVIFKWSFQRGRAAPLPEVLAVMKRAIHLTNRIEVRDIQLISLILMLDHNENRGRLSQINTGEGKTIVIAMLAAYFALKGHKVDIVTSSSALAIPQSQDFMDFYGIFDLSVDHNIENPTAYSCDIVYGVNLNYQGDILRSEFKREEGRGNRPFDIVIVDEVDNMFIDENKNVVLLSAPMPGMDQLEPLLALVSLNVDLVANTLIEKNDELYVRDFTNDTDGQNNEIPIFTTKEDYITANVLKIMKVHLRDDNRDTSLDEQLLEMKIPNHLREFVLSVQLNNWIRTAMQAKFHLQNNQQYIITNDMINIVDAQNTGTIQYNTTWSDALHQFVQMKHNKKLTPESLVSNYLSNVGFFCRYKKIYGLTGTLGNEHHAKLLNGIYNVDSVIIPPFKRKQHKELSAIVVNKKEDWYAKIIQSSLSKIRNGRAVLIITKYIEETDELQKRFLSADQTIKIKLYRTEDDSTAIQQTLSPKEIIIATNLGGRGTDIKPAPDMDINGGIHVCLTYFSENSRVRIQNCGRTSRTGNRGTSQFVILEEKSQSIVELRNIYAMQEAASLEKAQCEMKKVKTKDEIFQKFCQLLDSIESFDGSRVKEAIEERFAIWLKMHEHIIEDGLFEEYKMKFEDFKEAVLGEEKVKNPYFYVLTGNEKLTGKLMSLPLPENDLKFAIAQYNYAIKLDRDSIECAYYNRAVAVLLSASAQEQLPEFDEVIKDFQKARQIMVRKKKYFDFLLNTSEYRTNLHSQCLRKIKLYGVYIKSIDIAIGYDEQVLNEQIEALKYLMDSFDENDRKEIQEGEKEEKKREIEKLEKCKEIKGAIQTIQENASKLQIECLKPSQYLKNDDFYLYDEEIEEFKGNGWIPPIQISEKKKINWWEFIAVFTLGIAQVVGGVLVTIFTGGLSSIFGDALIMEGLGDCYRAIRDCIIKRNFSWVKFAKKKAVSFAISVALSAARYASVLAKGARTVTGMDLSGIFKFVASKLGISTVTSATANFTTDYVEDKTVEYRITTTIMEKIRPLINEKMMNHPLIVKMLTIDSTRNNHDWMKQISLYGCEVLNSMASSDFRSLKAALLSNSANIELEEIHAATQQISLIDEVSNFTEKFLIKLFVVVEEDEFQVNRIMSTLENLVHVNEGTKEGLVNKTTRAVAKKVMNVLQINNSDIPNVDLDPGVHYLTPKRILSRRNRVYKNTSESKVQNMNEPSIQPDHSISIDNNPMDSQKREVENNVEKVHKLMENITANVPITINELGIISDCLKRPITVWENGRFKYNIGEVSRKIPIEIQIFRSDNRSVRRFKKYNSDDYTKSLIEVISQQVNKDENELKDMILNYLQNNVEEICNINDIVRLEMYDEMHQLNQTIKQHNERCKRVNFIVDNSHNLNYYITKISTELFNLSPFNNDIVKRLATLSSKIEKTIEIYNNENILKYIIIKQDGHNDALKLEYQNESFLQLNHKESIDLTHDINTLNKFAKTNAFTFATDLSKMTNGFLSDYQEKLILLQALSAVVLGESFNEWITHLDEFDKKDFWIPIKDLELSQDELYMAFWREGQIRCTWPFDGVTLMMKAEGRDNHGKINVHLQVLILPPIF
uniref:Uncharacterized protein n=1 Tax=Bracon brevicornis TaxID=1563983 RepID=A0A6V7JEB5_9HYME